jgi:siroheme synthase (precorrin-2 oxidase/ferrochelatase)
MASKTGDDIQTTEHSPLFLKLREQSIRQISEMMEDTVNSMYKTEKAMERITTSLSGVNSTARIWSSFYDPQVVEKLKREKEREKEKEKGKEKETKKDDNSGSVGSP